MFRLSKALDNGIIVHEFLPAQAMRMADYLNEDKNRLFIIDFLHNPAKFWELAGDCIEGVALDERNQLGNSILFSLISAVFSEEVNPGFLSLTAAIASGREVPNDHGNLTEAMNTSSDEPISS